jgi:cysteinyl-tRNA synthetase
MAAKNALQEFAGLVHGVTAANAPNADVLGALRDDLNTPSAMSILHGLAKSAKRGDTAKAAELRATLEFLGLYGGETAAELSLQKFAQVDAKKVYALIEQRLEARKSKDFRESDRIRDEITAMGVVLKDAKDPKTGEIVTTWEMKR